MMLIRRRNNGIKLGRRIIRVFKWVTRLKCRNPRKYERLNGPNKALSKLCKWGKKIRRGLFNRGSTLGYIRMDGEPGLSKPVHVPKGHLAVYVGEPNGDTRRVLVPVLFLNHPLFGKLLKEAEDLYGFDHPGQITIPCPISEFENVKTTIAATGGKCRPLISGYVPGIKCLSL